MTKENIDKSAAMVDKNKVKRADDESTLMVGTDVTANVNTDPQDGLNVDISQVVEEKINVEIPVVNVDDYDDGHKEKVPGLIKPRHKIPSRNGINNVRVEEYLKLEHLEQLQNQFRSFQADDQEENDGIPLRSKFRRKSGFMNRSEFKSTVTQILGNTDCQDELDRLFAKLDTHGDNLVNWEEFVTYMLLYYTELDEMATKGMIPFRTEPSITLVTFNRQEVSQKMIAIENPTRYVSASKEGAVTVWDPALMSVESNYLAIRENQDIPGQKRMFKNWVTDMVYMQNCKKIAITTTGRDVHFFDVSTSQHFGQFHLFGLPDVPNCMAYWYDKKTPNKEAVLIFGDCLGALGVLTFHRPVSQLFEIPFMETKRLQEVFVKDLDKHAKHVKFVYIPDAVPDIILRLRYMPDSEHVIACSTNENKAVVIYDIHRKKASYTFRINRGCECFEYSKVLNALVTGSADHNARLWNPYVPNKPTALLKGHTMGVIDVAIHERLAQIFTYSRDAILKVWDAKEQVCIQTITLKLPGSAYGRLPEHGHFVFHLQSPPINSLLISANDYICRLKCGEVKELKSLYPIAHSAQLCAAIYNPHLKQVITGCDDSEMAIWDVETGNKSILLAHAHGDEEITSMAFDSSYRRLISGARNGSVKIWSIQNGHCIGAMEPIDGSEVTGAIHIPDRKCFITVGWSRQITTYDDSRQTISAIKPTSWKSHHKHGEDILAIAHCPPNLLATASFDGELLVWSTETERLFLRLRRGQKTEMSWKLRQLNVNVSGTNTPPSNSQTNYTPSNSRPNSRHRKSHRPENGYPAPVDKLLFLPRRLKNAGGGRYEGALLVSSEGGVLKWWTIFGSRHLLGEFYVPDQKDESVLSMCTDGECRHLVTGDTAGYITVWDIHQYCTDPQQVFTQSAPEMLSQWQAHDLAVVSVDWVDLDYGQFVVTASVDRAARLWGQQGQYVGSFGQKKGWTLKNEESWEHPKTPWKIIEEQLMPKQLVEDADKYRSTTPESSGLKSALTTTDSKLSKDKLRQTISFDDFSLMLAQKCEDGGSIGDIRREKTSLGIKAEKDFMRQRHGREARRGCFGGIDQHKTSRMNGKLCSPYHALTTPDVFDTMIPPNMPVTPRMRSKGYRPERINENTLKTMDLKFRPNDSLGFLEYNVKLPLLASVATAKFLSSTRKKTATPSVKKTLTFSRALTQL